MKLHELFLSFAKIGVMTFGGGYSMLPMLEKEVVENKKWATEEELLNYYAIGQCTPGVIAVNTATFIGTKNKGIIGGVIATLGVIFPSFIIISLLASVIALFKDNVYVLKAFSGIRVSVCALVASSVYKLSKKSFADYWCIIIALVAFCLQLLLSISSIYIVIGTVVFGVIFSLYGKRGELK